MRTRGNAIKNAPDDLDVGENKGSGKRRRQQQKKKSPAVEENVAPTTLPPLKEKKSTAKKRKQVVEEVGDVEVDEVEEKQKKKRKRYDSDFVIHCKPNGLCEIVGALKGAQEEDVKVVGFGGMLRISGISVTKTDLIRWLVERFNGRSQMLTISNRVSFVVTLDDICDLFLLPNGGLEVVRTEVKKDMPNRLLVEWEEKYGFKRTMSLTDMKKILETKFGDVGGPDFQRLFVLYSISSFLAPVSSQKMDWGLLECVGDVGKIASYNWCSYVLDRLCKGVETFRTSPTSKNISGCVLVLQILYFQRLKWKGRAEPSSLPLIQHWTTEKFKRRMREELSAGGWGQGEWMMSMYPISGKVAGANDDEGLRENERAEVAGKKGEGVDDGCAQEGGPVQPTKSIHFELMGDEKDDEEIRRIAQDDTHEAILLLKRDMDIVSRVHQKRLLKLVQHVKEKDCGESSVVTGMTESQKFFSDEQVLRLCDQIEANHKRMQELTSIPGPSFELLTPEPRYKMDAETKAAIEEMYRSEEEVAGIPDDCWPVSENSDFKCLFMRKYMKSSGDMSRKEKDVVDYCLSHRTLFEKVEKLNVFAHRGQYFISIDAIATLNDGRFVSTAVIDAWALMLNKRGGSNCFYMNTQHSLYLHNLVNGVQGELDFAKKVRGCWDQWVKNMGDLANWVSFDFIFIPIWIAEHFFAVVVNLVEQKVQNLDNMMHSKLKNALYANIQKTVKSQMAIFLEEKEHPKAGDIEQYVVEDVRFAWKGCAGANGDCGIFLMNHMEFFRGHPYENPSLKNRADRRSLRAKYCATLLLSDVNDMKNQLERDVLEFSNSRK
ncbi:hypothetical protein CASFOL_022196 [Castilleja foliolosa]|uniref:Ubiquitin-like protease family profile domain-containing protein n=1 Tax=Castilleja foliolosa TaxID=1961234 RepID=A0ABD3CV65_9LAMI